MKLVVYTSDGGELAIQDFDSESAMDLVESLRDSEDRFHTFDLGDGATVLVNVDHVVRVDLG